MNTNKYKKNVEGLHVSSKALRDFSSDLRLIDEDSNNREKVFISVRSKSSISSMFHTHSVCCNVVHIRLTITRLHYFIAYRILNIVNLSHRYIEQHLLLRIRISTILELVV